MPRFEAMIDGMLHASLSVELLELHRSAEILLSRSFDTFVVSFPRLQRLLVLYQEGIGVKVASDYSIGLGLDGSVPSPEMHEGRSQAHPAYE